MRSAQYLSVPILPPIKSASSAPKAPSEQWFYVSVSSKSSRDQKRKVGGPATRASLKRLFSDAKIGPSTLLWRPGEGGWRSVEDRPKLHGELLLLEAEGEKPKESVGEERRLVDLSVVHVPEFLEDLEAHFSCEVCGAAAELQCRSCPSADRVRASVCDAVGSTRDASEILKGSLWIGNAAATRPTTILALGITHVVNLDSRVRNVCKSSVDPFVSAVHWRDFHFQQEDTNAGVAVVAADEDALVEIMDHTDNAFSREGYEKTRLLLASRSGNECVPLVCSAYLMRREGLTAQAAMQLLKEARESIVFTEETKSRLKSLEDRYTRHKLYCETCFYALHHPNPMELAADPASTGAHADATMRTSAKAVNSGTGTTPEELPCSPPRGRDATAELTDKLRGIPGLFRNGTLGKDDLCGDTMATLDLAGLGLEDLHIAAVAQALPRMPRLRVLKLAYNRLSDDAVIALVSVRVSEASPRSPIAGLEDLDLSYNAFAVEGAVALAEALAAPDTDSKIPCAREGFYGGATPLALKSLDISFNPIGDEGGATILNALAPPEYVQTLGDFDNDHGEDGNGRTEGESDTPPGSERRTRAPSYNDRIKALRMAGCRLGKACAKRLSDVAKFNLSLQRVELSFNPGMRRSEVRRLVSSLRLYHTPWREVGLAQSGAGNEILGAFARFTSDEGSCLQNLLLQGNDYTSSGVRRLAHALERNEALLNLDLSGNPLGDQGASHLARGLAHNGTLLHLILTDCGLSTAALRPLAALLAHNRALMTLNLAENALTKLPSDDHGGTLQGGGRDIFHIGTVDETRRWDGWEAFSRALRENGALRALDLTGVELGPRGVHVLCGAFLPTGAAKQHADGVEASSEDPVALPALPPERIVNDANCWLETLKLAKNRIRNDGARSLAAILLFNYSLKNIDLSCNGITSRGVVAMEDALRTNSSSPLPKKVFDLDLDLAGNDVSAGDSLICRHLARSKQHRQFSCLGLKVADGSNGRQ